jgi:hypothetical protein
MSERPQDAPRGGRPDSPSIELGRILDELDRARRSASARSRDLIGHARPSSTASLLAPLGEPAPPERVTDERAGGMATAPILRPAVPFGAPAAHRAAGRSALVVRLRGLARPVSTVIVTTTLVLCGWLLVLEPALGSRPVLVRDDSMSPTLRVGDVAFAEEAEGSLASGTIVAVRRDGRVDVTRLIDREQVPPGSDPATRAAAPLVVRDDAEGLDVRAVVARDDLNGVIGAAVPRVGLPVVWLRSPTTAPLGTLAVLFLLGVTALGVVDGIRERVARRPVSAVSR